MRKMNGIGDFITTKTRTERNLTTNGLVYCKSVLANLLRGQYDQFEIISIARSIKVEVDEESSFSRQKHLLQAKILERILREDKDSKYKELLRETRSLCNVPKILGYQCCFSGCPYVGDIHKKYVRHLQVVHPNHQTFVCQYKHDCRGKFSSHGALLQHIRDRHSVGKRSVFRVQSVADIACKCSMLRCGGRQFSNVKGLITHVNTVHSADPRECIFENCSKVFPSKAQSRKHFRTMHSDLSRAKLKVQHLVNRNEDVHLNASNNIPENADIESESGLTFDIDVYNDDEMSELETGTEDLGPEDGEYFLMAYADFFNRMTYINHIPESTVQKIVSEFSKQSLRYSSLREKSLRIALSKIPQVEKHQIEKVVSESILKDPMVESLNELNTSYKRIKFIQENFKYVHPVEIVLNKEEVASGKPKECFHYVSVVECLKQLIEDKTFVKVQEMERENGMEAAHIVKDIKDGIAFKKNKYFQENPEAFVAIFYSDAVELVNPLGAARGKHKIINVFWTLAEIPKQQRSKIDRMHLAMVVKEKYVKKYGYGIVYRKLIDDLLKLQSGIVIDLPVRRIIKCGVLVHVGDNLESHTVGGFSICFSSRDICRFCHIQHDELCENIHDLTKPGGHCYWTVEDYDKICDNIEGISESTGASSRLTVVSLEEMILQEESDEEESVIEDSVIDNSNSDNDETDNEEVSTGDKYGLRERCPFNELQVIPCSVQFSSRYPSRCI